MHSGRSEVAQEACFSVLGLLINSEQLPMAPCPTAGCVHGGEHASFREPCDAIGGLILFSRGLLGCSTYASLLLNCNDLLRFHDAHASASANPYKAQVGRHRHGNGKAQKPLTTDLDDLCNALMGLLSPDFRVVEARNLPQLLHSGHDLINGSVDQAEVISLLGLQG